jgi:hypothetical protein
VHAKTRPEHATLFGTPDGFLKIMKDNTAVPHSFAIVAVLANTGPDEEFPGTGHAQEIHAPSRGDSGKSGAALKDNHWVVIERVERILANGSAGHRSHNNRLNTFDFTAVHADRSARQPLGCWRDKKGH